MTIDLFTTSMNHRLQVYFSPIVDRQSAGTDALLQWWDGLQACAFPPFGLIPRVLAKVRQSRNLEVTLVAPFWPQKPWFSDLLELLVDVPVLLPMRKDLLRQLHFHHFHRNLHARHMTDFHIASASLLAWRADLPTVAALPPA